MPSICLSEGGGSRNKLKTKLELAERRPSLSATYSADRDAMLMEPCINFFTVLQLECQLYLAG